MTYDELRDHIEQENSSKHSVDDQTPVADLIYRTGYRSDEQYLTRRTGTELVEGSSLRPNYKVSTIMDNLQECEVLAKYFPPGPKRYVISERLDEIVSGRTGTVLAQERRGLKRRITVDSSWEADTSVLPVTDGGESVARSVIANALDVPPRQVERELHAGNLLNQIYSLNASIDALRNAEGVVAGGGYGKLLFRHQAYRYHLTKMAIQLREE